MADRHPAPIRVYEYYARSSMTIQNFDITAIEDITTEKSIEENTIESTTETNTLETSDGTQTITDITTDSINTETNTDSTDIYPSKFVNLN